MGLGNSSAASKPSPIASSAQPNENRVVSTQYAPVGIVRSDAIHEGCGADLSAFCDEPRAKEMPTLNPTRDVVAFLSIVERSAIFIAEGSKDGCFNVKTTLPVSNC
jgi:hypothetical protein